MSQIPLVRIHDVNHFQLDNIAQPKAGPDDVVIKVSLCGICGSDLSYIAMGGLLGPGVPMPIGHELSGTIFETGANVQHVAVGDRVIVNPEGNNNRIGNIGPEGAFSPYLLVRGAALDETAVLKLPDSLSMEQGAMVEPLAVAMHAVHQGRISADDKVVIFGAGPIGLGIVLVLKYYGVNNIIVSDLSEKRLAIAESLGAKRFKGSSKELTAFLTKTHGTAEVHGLGTMPATDLYFEATGVGTVFNQAVEMARRGARVVVVGVNQTPVELNLVNLLMRELSITGSMAYPTEFPEVVRMLESGKVDIAPLITHRYPLSQFGEAISSASNTEQAVKVMIDCQH